MTRSPKLYEGSRQTSKKENSRCAPLGGTGEGTRHSPVQVAQRNYEAVLPSPP